MTRSSLLNRVLEQFRADSFRTKPVVHGIYANRLEIALGTDTPKRLYECLSRLKLVLYTLWRIIHKYILLARYCSLHSGM